MTAPAPYVPERLLPDEEDVVLGDRPPGMPELPENGIGPSISEEEKRRALERYEANEGGDE